MPRRVKKASTRQFCACGQNISVHIDHYLKHVSSKRHRAWENDMPLDKMRFDRRKGDWVAPR